MKTKTFTMALLNAVLVSGAAQAQSKVYDLRLLPQNVHWGYYDARVKPVLRITSGDSVRVETMVARGIERLHLAGVKDEEIPASVKAVEQAIQERGPGAHPLTGPIYVEGAEPGDTVEVHIQSFEFLHPYGVVGFFDGIEDLKDVGPPL